jgi:hypothetical protein
MQYDPADHTPTRRGIAAAWVATLLIGAVALGGPAALCTSVQAAQSGIQLVENYAQSLGEKIDRHG